MVEDDYRTRIKICGLTKLEHVRYASGAGADFLGFIFYGKSPRFVNPSEAAVMISWIEGPRCVGVFVDQSLDDVNEIARITGIDLVQLHGKEAPEYCDLIDKPVIKAFRVHPGLSRESLEELVKPYLGHVDYFMFDTYSKTASGGTGTTFNWDVLKGWNPGKPFFLAGGISQDNVASAIEQVHPYAVDVSSSLEESPGIKDLSRIDAFFEEVKRIWETQVD